MSETTGGGAPPLKDLVGGTGRAGIPASLDTLLDMSLPVSIEFGRTSMTVQEVLALGTGSVIQLERMVGEPIDIFVSDRKLAEGEVVVIGEHFGVRITRVLVEQDGAEAARVSFGALTGLLGACAITGGLLVLALKLLQRLGKGGVSRGKLPFQVLDRFALGPKQGLAVVRVGRRVLLLATSEHGPRLITEIRGEDRLAVLAADPVPAPSRRPDKELSRLLSRLTLTAILAIGLAGTAGAQAKPDPGKPVAISPPASVAPKLPQAAAPGSHAIKVAPPSAPNVDVRIGQGTDQLKLSGSVGLVVFLGALTLLPAVVLLMTSFTRILIVLHFLRSALGTQGSPPGQLLVAIAVLLTGVVMNPVIQEVNQVALQPYFAGQIAQNDAYDRALKPFRRFMLANVREKDLAAFTEMSGVADLASIDEIPTLTVISAFVTSELQAAFWMGFVIFLPFVVVDLIVATSLMSLGMFMVPPVMISLPFKLLLFVLADGWSLVGQNLVASFHR